MTITQFTIRGERNSGTNFLQYAMLFNFNLNYVMKDKKHFFGHHPEEEYAPDIVDNTLFLCIVRDPVDWIDSLFKRLHHIPPENKVNIKTFMNNEFYSIYEEGSHRGKEIMEDRNMYTGERYRNIFEMRRTKLKYMSEEIPKHVNYYYHVRYEDLRDNYDTIMSTIAYAFDLKPKMPGVWLSVPKIKGTYDEFYKKKPILLPLKVQEEILEIIKEYDYDCLRKIH